MNIEDIKIDIYITHNKKDTLAFVKISIPVEIDGVETFIDGSFYRIMPKRYGIRAGQTYRVVPPKIKAGIKYKAVIVLKDEELWYRLEEKILAEYEKALKTNMKITS
jgi:hypothetical protein